MLGNLTAERVQEFDDTSCIIIAQGTPQLHVSHDLDSVDDPSAYVDQSGFDFLTEVPTTWDETRFLVGEPGEYVVIARRNGDAWFVGGCSSVN